MKKIIKLKQQIIYNKISTLRKFINNLDINIELNIKVGDILLSSFGFF